jgi:predicted regulator of Ras-like GTPase activity (Roadblock/LC7/MglB family)
METLNRILRTLQAESPDVTATALLSDDGLIVASALPQTLEEARVGGMSATLLALGTRAAAELGIGRPQQVLVRADSGFAVLATAAAGTVLLVLTTEHARLGLLFLDMARAAREIAKVL